VEFTITEGRLQRQPLRSIEVRVVESDSPCKYAPETRRGHGRVTDGECGERRLAWLKAE
jgi:hypothetical protein